MESAAPTLAATLICLQVAGKWAPRFPAADIVFSFGSLPSCPRYLLAAALRNGLNCSLPVLYAT